MVWGLAQLEGQKHQFETALARQIPEMNLEQKLRAADRRAVALTLPGGVSLVEFIRFHPFDFYAVAKQVGEAEWLPIQRWKPAHYLAFVYPAGATDDVQMIDLGEAAPIDRMIHDFRAGVMVPPEDRRGRDVVKRRPQPEPTALDAPGLALRRAVFDKLVPALAGCTHLLLALDGDLTRLPVGVLPTERGLLLDDYHISYLGAGRDVLRFGAATAARPAPPLVVADPDFELAEATPTAPTPQGPPRGRHSRDFDRSRYRFGPLPATRPEREHIAALLGVQPWLGRAVLEALLKQACASPRILHLATHGFFLEDQPHDPNAAGRDLTVLAGPAGGPGRLTGPLPENPLLRAGLALAGAQSFLDGRPLPTEAEDGLLTAEDVSGLDLLATELVVLSACETGLGELRTGEGVFGLQRAFTIAGARTLVMSLWSVPDEQTQELMTDFYQRILAGEPRAAALRQA